MNKKRLGKLLRCLAILCVFAGLILSSGCSFTEAQWISPEIAGAEARKMNVESNHTDRTNHADELLHEAEVGLKIEEIENQKELLEAAQVEKLKEIEAAAQQQQALLKAELEHQVEMNRQELAVLQQQEANLKVQAEQQALLNQQKLEEEARLAEIDAQRQTFITYALFIGLLLLFVALSFAIMVSSWRRYRKTRAETTITAAEPDSPSVPVNTPEEVFATAGVEVDAQAFGEANREYWQYKRKLAQATERARRQKSMQKQPKLGQFSNPENKNGKTHVEYGEVKPNSPCPKEDQGKSEEK